MLSRWKKTTYFHPVTIASLQLFLIELNIVEPTHRCMVKFYLMTFLFSFSLFMDLLAINMEEEEEEPTPSSSLSFSWWVHPFRKSGFSQQGDGFVRCSVHGRSILIHRELLLPRCRMCLCGSVVPRYWVRSEAAILLLCLQDWSFTESLISTAG